MKKTSCSCLTPKDFVSALGKLVFTGPDDNKLVCCPDDLVKDWYHHPVFGVRFRAFLDAFHEDTLGKHVV